MGLFDYALYRVISLMRLLRRKGLRAENKRHMKKLKKCGAGVKFNGLVHIAGHSSIVIHDDVHAGDNAYIRGEGRLCIGENNHISMNLAFYTINHDYEGGVLPYDNQMVPKPVVVGKNVWIGMDVCIAPGTTIGNGCIIGMGAVVSGSVPDLAIVGTPNLRVLAHRDAEHY